MLAPGCWTRLLRMTFVSLMILLAACSAPQPARPSSIPTSTASGTPIPSDPQLLPVLDRTIELGTRGQIGGLTHPIALDEQNRRLYVSTSFSKTVVLDAETLTQIGELDVGGSVAVLPERDRLYIGVPGTTYADGRPNIPAQLHVYEASTLAQRSSATFTWTIAINSMPLTIVPDPQTGQVYVAYQGVYIADADSLEVTGVLTGTLPASGPGSYDARAFVVTAALEPVQRRLFIITHSGSGHSSGVDLRAYDLSSEQWNRYTSAGMLNLAFDPAASTAFVSHFQSSGADTLVKFDAQGKEVHRLNSVAGHLQIDPLRDRVYVLNVHRSQLSVFDRELNYSGDVNVGSMTGFLDFAIDVERDRLFILTSDGLLQVWRGHGRALRDQPPQPVPPRGAIQWIVPSPDFEHDRTVMAAFVSGSAGAYFAPLFISHNGGQTWQMVMGLPTRPTAMAPAFSPDYARDRTLWVSFAGAFGGDGVYRSTDGGQTWQPTSRGLTDLAITRLIASPDFAHDQTVFALASHPNPRDSLFRSTDGGLSWTPLITESQITTLAVSPNFARDQRVLIGGVNGLQLSHDGGNTWRQVLAGFAKNIAYLADGQTVYSMLGDGSVRRSDDGGGHWVAASDGLSMPLDGSVNLLAGDDFVLLAADAYERPTRLFYRPLKDQPWREVDPIAQSLGSVFALARNGLLLTEDVTGQLHHYVVDHLQFTASHRRPTGLVDAMAVVPTSTGNATLIGGQFGVWASSDLKNWFDTGFADRNRSRPIQLLVSPNYAQDHTVFATAEHGLYRSRGPAWQWELLSIGSGAEISIDSVAISPNFATDHTLLIAGHQDDRPQLLASADAGDTWTALALPVTPSHDAILEEMQLSMTSDGVWWNWNELGLFHSADRGRTWSKVLEQTSVPLQPIIVSPDYVHGGTIWIPYGTSYQTQDAGKTWQAAPLSMNAHSFTLSPDYAHDRTLYMTTYNDLLRSSDAGATWSSLAGGLPPKGADLMITALAISPEFATDNTLLVATYDGRLIVSHDRGDTWSIVD